MDEQKSTILIVEDDLDVADMLNAYFRVQGYEVLTVNWGEDGVRACQTSQPNLVILDIRLPDIDGFEVARRLRTNRKTKDIPIIFLTEKRDRVDRLQGLGLQADDYITKPFDIQELRLRVRNTLNRAKQATLTNPVTEVPEGSLVNEHLEQWLHNPSAAIFVVSLKNLDYFRETYGFVASDDLLRAVALMMRDTLRDLGSLEDFFGHLSQTDFVLISKAENKTTFVERLRKRLEQSFEYFYRDQDRNQGVFEGKSLAVEIKEYIPSRQPARNLEQLIAALEKIYR